MAEFNRYVSAIPRIPMKESSKEETQKAKKAKLPKNPLHNKRCVKSVRHKVKEHLRLMETLNIKLSKFLRNLVIFNVHTISD